jgi:hypothetical protein
MADEILSLRYRSESAQAEIKKISKEVIDQCEEIINLCNERKNTFGEPKNEGARAEAFEMCFARARKIDSLSQNALDRVVRIYNAVLRFNELCIFSKADSEFFSQSTTIGNAFEDLFEREIGASLGGILDGLDLDDNGACIKMNLVISNAQNIANSVSKATKFYFPEE